MIEPIYDPESAEAYQVRDRYGHHYRLTIYTTEGFCFFKLYDGKAHAGYANCGIGEQSFKLLDLHIEDTVPRGCLSFWRTNFRKRGLGTVLLDQVINRARALDLQHVTGQIVQHDDEANPNLRDWYRRHGFTVTLVNSGSKVVATLCLDLEVDLEVKAKVLGRVEDQ